MNIDSKLWKLSSVENLLIHRLCCRELWLVIVFIGFNLNEQLDRFDHINYTFSVVSLSACHSTSRATGAYKKTLMQSIKFAGPRSVVNYIYKYINSGSQNLKVKRRIIPSFLIVILVHSSLICSIYLNIYFDA